MPALVPQGTPVWVHSGGGTSTPVWPTGYTPTAGDRAYIYTDVVEGNATLTYPGGWTRAPAAANPPTNIQALIYKDLVGGDTLPAMAWATGFQTSSICVVTRGEHAAIASCVETGNTRQSTSTGTIPSAACTVGNSNDFLLAMGMRYKTATGNGETIGALTHFTALAAASVPSGTSLVSTIGYWQQTTATSTAVDAQACSLQDSNLTCRGWTVVFKTLAVPTAGFTTQPTVTAATSIPNGQYTLAYTPTGGAGTFYAVAVAAGSATPSTAQIEGGQDANGNAALAAVVDASAGGADTAVLGGSVGNPVYDIHCVYRTTVDSSVVSLRSQFLQATAAFEFAVVTGAPVVGTVSILTGASPPAVAGDIIESSQFTTPSNDALAITGTGTPQFIGDGSRQSFQYRIFQVSTSTWSALVTGFVNDSPPVFQNPGTRFVSALNALIAPIPLGGFWTSTNGDPITVTAVSGLPPGIFVSGSQLVGAGTVQGVYTIQLSGADLAGTAAPGSLIYIVGNVQLPNPLKGLTQSDAQDALEAAFLTPRPVLVPAAGPSGIVLDSTPPQGSFAAPFSDVVLSISSPLPVVTPPDGGSGSPPGGPVTPPPIQSPGQIVSRGASVQLVLSDLFQYVGDDLSLSNSQDLLLVDGAVMGAQRVLRRLITNPGDYFFNPTYGAGLPKFVGQTTDVAKISALIQSQMLLESAVSQAPAPVVTVTSSPTDEDAGSLSISIQYTDAPSGKPTVLSFPLPS